MNGRLSLIYCVPQTITADNIFGELSKYEMTRENYCLKPKTATATTPEPRELHKQEQTKPCPQRPVSPKVSTTPPMYSDYTAVDVPNSLFWCLYIGKVGLSDYEVIPPNKHKNVEMEQKQKAITFLTSTATKWNKQINHKITNIKFRELMTDMLLNKDVDVYIAFLLSLYYDLHIYVINSEETVYMEYIPDTTKYVSGAVYANTIILKLQNSGKYSIDTEATSDKVERIQAMYRVDQLCKPVSGASTFKTPELTEVLRNLGVETTGKKADMFVEYRKYIENCGLFIV